MAGVLRCCHSCGEALGGVVWRGGRLRAAQSSGQRYSGVSDVSVSSVVSRAVYGVCSIASPVARRCRGASVAETGSPQLRSFGCSRSRPKKQRDTLAERQIGGRIWDGHGTVTWGRAR